jgi:hypothetical protein
MRTLQSGIAVLCLSVPTALALTAQDATPTPAPTPTPTPATTAESSPVESALKEPVAFRPIEANVIINLPSVEVPSEKTLTFLVTHRFTQAVQQGNINNFFTLDQGNTWGFGLWYAPFKNLDVGLYRSSNLATYEATVQYQLPSLGGFASSIRAGEDWRTETEPPVATPKSSFFAQVILAYNFGQYVRISAVPTYLQDTNGFPIFLKQPVPGDQSCVLTDNSFDPYRCSGLYKNIFNVPIAASIAITHSITIHGEVIPRLSKVNSNGVGWSVSVEKALLRHRFAFFAGNQRQTTVDEYTQAIPMGVSPSNIYLGFNLFRAWNFK